MYFYENGKAEGPAYVYYPNGKFNFDRFYKDDITQTSIEYNKMEQYSEHIMECTQNLGQINWKLVFYLLKYS